MKKGYFFDFDGTLTRSDSMFLFLRFYHPILYYIQCLIFSPAFVLLKLGFLGADEMKRKFISSILKGERKTKIEKKSEEFFAVFYPKLIRENALEYIEKLDKQEANIFIVTASLDIWVKPFAEKWGCELISTRAKYTEGKYSGYFVGKNCNGQEKVKRIREVLKAKNIFLHKTIAFGDTSGDIPMIRWADEGFYRYFD
ncbi:MAG: HAD-IB family hydrolase [Bergeyella sp.]|nr:HAD-IB family hydrolase [Bergeyella sp.]